MLHAARKLYWEDFVPGQVTTHGPRRISREEIVTFAAEYDPQPLHLDESAARASLLGGLCASGWHTCCIAMRMAADGILLGAHSMGAPGIDEVRWLAPVRPDDELTLRATVLDKRPSRSRPEVGFVRFLFEIHNARGERLMTILAPLMFGRGQGGQAKSAAT